MTSRHVLAARQLRMQEKERHERVVSSLDTVVSTLTYPALLVFLIYPYGDFDWGWHYRYGKYLFTRGRILRHDPFSWTMPGV